MRFTDYCLDLLSLAGMFFIRGSAPPPSKKLTDTPELPPRFDEASFPLKYGRRLTSAPLYVPVARMPGTLTPTFGWVSGSTHVSQFLGGLSGLPYSFQ